MTKFILIVALHFMPAHAATYWVRPTGTMGGCTASETPPASDSGYKNTISSGIQCLSSGDTLNIREGTYLEDVGGHWGEGPHPPSGSGFEANPYGLPTWGQIGTPTIVQAYNFEVVTIKALGISS